LSFFNLSVKKLFHTSTAETNQVVVVLAFVQLKNGFTRLKVVAREQTRLLELHQYAVYRRQTHIGTFREQNFVDIFCGKVALSGLLKNLQYLDAWQRGLQAAALEFFCVVGAMWGHGASL
jgi:recombinational DNA repair protein RecT